MSQLPEVISKNPELHASEDFYKLRRDGIGFVEEMGSHYWTDYNTHDPGITILEALCYAITDLAYRSGWDMKDLLMPETPSTIPGQPFPFQSFFTARHILSVNPVTPDDFRRVLIDLDMVRNAWLICKECSCDLHFYSWCEDNELKYAFEKPINIIPEPVRMAPRGMYEVLLELERDPQLGDLNDLKIERSYTVFGDEGKVHEGIVELRFPEWGLEKRSEWDLFLQSDDAFNFANGQSVQLSLMPTSLPAHKDITLLPEIEFKRNWRNPYSVSYELELLPGGEIIPIQNISIRIFGDETIKSKTSLASILTLLKELSTDGFISLHRSKQKQIQSAVQDAKKELQRHRNLDEDYCLIRPVQIDDVAICADIEVEPNADLENVQAKIWFEIEKYFNPPINFYTLDELLEEKMPVEEIFNGPALSHGFIKAKNLEKADLKKVLRVSDIINELMDIEGVIAVNNLLLTKYDHQSNVVSGDSDPVFINDQPQFDPNKSSARWLLYVTDQHQPRMYRQLSRFLFYKNGLPFLPRKDEANDTYIQLCGMADRPKLPGVRNDLEIPTGTYRNPGTYIPIQNTFPVVYGISPEGLPSHAKKERRAQARQLKAYLQVYEQQLGNAMQQLEHLDDLFSLNPAIGRTYYALPFSDDIVSGFSTIAKATYNVELDIITEREPEALRRRNLFLNHLLSRFGENLEEYALLITRWHGEKIGQEELIKDKISFFNAFPRISHNRYKAFDYTLDTHKPENTSGLHDRISILLGNPILHFTWNTLEFSPGVFDITTFKLTDTQQTSWLTGSISFSAGSIRQVEHIANKAVIRQMVRRSAYIINPVGARFEVILNDENSNPMGHYPLLFSTREEAIRFRDELIAWAAQTRAIVIEHLLLRPKFSGDALYPGCIDGPCFTCGDEDPYSFRLTVAMPGWIEPYSSNLDMRGFADRTIREQVPSHLVAKICWVGNEGFIFNQCDPIIMDLTELLIAKSQTAGGNPPTEDEACTCSNAIYEAFSEAFSDWYADKTLLYIDETALRNELEILFTPIDLSALSCVSNITSLQVQIQHILIQYFVQVVINGWQFEKFETAWYEWLEVNEKIDWIEERLHDRVEAILDSNLISGDRNQLCSCTDRILSKYGTTFYEWMEDNFKAGMDFENFTAFVPEAISLCDGFEFTPDTLAILEVLLEDRYDHYRKVSYHLWKVAHLLAQLRNTYPGATLHDCDDGSDDNPVRLGSTALGNYSIKTP